MIALKALYLFVVLIGFHLPSDDLNDLEKHRLKGSVRSVMETKYAIEKKQDADQGRKILYQKLTIYNRAGYIDEIALFRDGKEYLKSMYLSGSDGKPFEMNEFLPDGTLDLKVVFVCDEKKMISEAFYNWSENRVIGEICEMVDYYDDIIKNEIFTSVQYKYEYRGYCIEKNYLKPDGNPSFKITAKYDFNGNKLESAYFHGNGTLSWITKYKYDRYDNLIESRVFKSNRIAVLSGYKYQFDYNGNWISRKEDREVHINILTAGLNQSDMITERTIEYY